MTPIFHADASLFDGEKPSSSTGAVPDVHATTDSARALLEEFALSDTVPEISAASDTACPAPRLRPLSFSELDEPGED